MSQVTIYGASDDLIEVEGTITDEFGASRDDEGYVVFSTGDVFRVSYNERGVWDVEHSVTSGELEVEITKAPPGEDPEPYTDHAEVSGDFTWVDCWPTYPPEDEHVQERLKDNIEGLSGDALMAAYNAALGRT